MKRVVCILLLLSTLIMPVYADPVEDESEIVVIGVQLEHLYNKSASDLESIIYPSGLQLPTKYWDVLDCIPYTSPFIVNNTVSQFLNKCYPNAARVFTFAEYRAAERFIYFNTLKAKWDNVNDVCYALSKLEKETNLKMFSDYSNVTLTSSEAFLKDIKRYETILEKMTDTSYNYTKDFTYLELINVTYRGYPLSAGFGVDYTDTSNLADPAVPYGGLMSGYIECLTPRFKSVNYAIQPADMWLEYQDDLLIVRNPSQEEGVEIDLSTVNLASDYNKNYFEYAKDSPIYKQEEIKIPETPVDPNAIGTDLPALDDEYFNYTSKVQLNRVAGNEIAPFLDTDGLENDEGTFSVNHIYGLRDLAGILSVIFISISLISLWVVHTIRMRNDPVRKWTRRK